ncbi:hypothetical protein ACLRDI_30585 [Pseudomonas piscis]|uniref:hypothetical protein n=1 Tax=Pseudomonas piscis TaxID=2614538 RepID=UPI0039A62DAD
MACLAFLIMIPGYFDAAGLGRGSSGRRRVFSPGFVVLCVCVAAVELIALNHFYGARECGESGIVKSKQAYIGA